jgi:metallo-beta-lactamase family protein
MQKIEFLGAASGEVTGSSYLVTADDTNQILVDFGMFQGDPAIVKKNYEPLAFHPASLQAVFLTHAHLDHSGRLPLLVFGGFTKKIYMTAPSKAFVELILMDSARIAEKESIKEPLYTSEEVIKLLRMIHVVNYNEEIELPSFKAVFRDAGHILGSSSIEITDTSGEKPQKIVFSGDLGNTPQNIVKPTQYIDSADFVVMESTYGDSEHPAEDAAEIIAEEINAVDQDNGVLLIPAFALERTQEILHIIHHLKKDGKISSSIPVYLDSPMGIDATSIYLKFEDYHNEEMRSHTDIPFNSDELVITDDSRDSKHIFKEPNPKVIIAGSGMMAGGRIMHHAKNYLEESTTRILFVGYQADETVGRDILDGKTTVVIDKERITVRAHVREIKILSSHADQPRLITWLSHIKGVKKVFLTHGEQPQRETLREKIIQELGITDVHLPSFEESFDLNQ